MLELAIALFASDPAAGVAGMFDYRALSLARIAGCHVDEASEDVALGASDLAAPAAEVAGHTLGARFSARSAADGAVFESGGAQFFLASEHGVDEVELDLNAQVAAANGAGGASSAEEGVENVAKPAEVEAFEAGALSECTDRAVLVVLGFLLGVGKHFVGGRDSLEDGLGRILFCGVGDAVGVMLHRQSAKGATDVILRGVAGDAKDFVEVVRLGHEAVSSLGADVRSGYR